MSNAVTAVVNDVSAIGLNPAGLTQMKRPEFQLVVRTLVNATSATGTTNTVTSTGFPRYSAEGEFQAAIDPLEYAAAAVPVRVLGRTITAGVAYRRFGEGLRPGAFKQTRRSSNGRYFNVTTYNTTGGMRAISPSLGVEISERLRVGVTANVLSGSSTYTVRTTPITAGVAPVAVTTRVSENDYAGLALETGLQFRVSDGLHIGAHVTLPHDRTFSRDSATTSVAATRAAPMQIAVGVAKRLNAKTVLTVDARTAPWSSVETTADGSGTPIIEKVGVNDAASVHVGWERDVSDEDRQGILRVGAFAGQTSSVDLNGDAIASFGASVGKSWIMPNSVFEMGFQIARSSEWTRTSDTVTTVRVVNYDYTLSIGLRRLLGRARD